MPGFNIHLSVAKEYIKKSGIIKNETAFLKGSLAPDLVKDKNLSHYSAIRDKKDLQDFLSKKVRLYEYLKVHDPVTDYGKGIFLHLITDYLFFSYFLDKDYLHRVTFEQFQRDLYYSYDETNAYLIEKYEINYNSVFDGLELYMKTAKKKANDDVPKNIIIDIYALDEFIEYVASMDLEAYKQKVLLAKRNVLPIDVPPKIPILRQKEKK